MQKLLEELQASFDPKTRMTRDEKIKINRSSLTTFNFIYLRDICVIYSVDLEVKRSGTGLVLIFKKLS